MGASNDERANAVADWFARAATQNNRMQGITAASKENVKYTKAQQKLGRQTLKAEKSRTKNGVKYLPGQAPNENLTAAPTLHLINGRVVKGTANKGGVLSDSNGDAINNPGGEAPALGRDDFLDTMFEKQKKDVPWLGGIIDAAHAVSKNTPLGDAQNALFNNSDPLGRPQNAGQWVINALSSPLYAVAEGSHAVGEAVAENEAKGLKHDLNPFGPAGAIGSIGTFLGGAGRGIAEGVGGARYADNPTPRTLGSNLEELGTKKLLQDTLGKDAGNIAQGVVGGTADVVGDPSTWLTLGAGAAARGAATGAREAAAAARAATREAAGVAARDTAADATVLAERYAGKPPTAAQIKAATRALPPAALSTGGGLRTPLQGALAGAKKEFSQNVLRPTFSDPVKAIYKSDTKRLKKAWNALTDEERAIAVKLPKEDFQQGVLAAAARKKQGGGAFPEEALADTITPTSIPKGLTGMLNPEAAAARSAGIDELLPNITSREVPAGDILARASTEGAGGTIGDAEHAAIQSAIATSTSPARWEAAVSGLRQSASTRAFLDSTMQVGTREMKVADVARKLATGDPLSPAYQRFQDALNGAISQAKGRTGAVSQPQLAQALSGEGLAPDLASGDLVDKLNSVPFEARKNILQTLVGGGRRFKTFDAAMNAAVNGEVDATMMRSMLKRLGINTKASDPEQLRTLLNGSGRTNWEQIKASVRTPQEVLDIHGIDDTAVAAANDVDLAEALPGAQAVHDRAVQSIYGYDPAKIAPLKQDGKITGDSTGAAIWEAQQRLGTLFRKGEATEAYDLTALREVHSAIVRELSQIANVRGMSGAERAAYLVPRYRQATLTVESGNLATGIMPRVVSEKDAIDPLFVSWGQIISEIPDDTLARALFSPDFERASFAAEKGEAFRQGFTAYPTVIADGVRAAVNGAPAETVAIAMRQLHGNISRTAKNLPQLDAIYREIADHITQPGFIAKMRELDAVQQPMAYKLSLAAAEGIVQPLSQRIIEVVSRAGDQGATRDEIQALIDQSRREAASAAGYPSLVADTVQQRMDNGFVNGVLGEYGSMVLNAQERMVRANKVAGAAGGGRKKLPAQNKARVDTLDDFEPHIMQSSGATPGSEKGAPPLGDPVDELANLETKWELMDGVTGVYRTTQRLGVALSGRYGMDGMKDALVEGQTTNFLVSAQFNRGLREWLHGKRSAFSARPTGGLPEKIAAGRGLAEPVPTETAVQYTRDWWSALAAAPADLDGEALIAALRRGAPTEGLTLGARGLEEWEIPHALQMRGFIDQVFDEGDRGLFSRMGLQTSDVITELRRYQGFKKGREFEGALPVSGTALDAQAHIWRGFDVASVNPLDLLDQYMAAMSAASVKPGVGAQISKLWGRYNPSADEIKQLGLKRLNTTGSQADLARYVDPNAYFTAGERRQMSFLQQAMNYSRDFPEGLAPVVRAYDALTRVLKSSATVWRPGHHITNILGDMFMNLLAGVNPLHAIRAVKMMRTWGQMIDADLGPLGYLERATRPIGRETDLTPDARFGSDFITVRVNGKAQPLSLQEAMQYAHRSGVAMTHAAVMDMAETGGGRITRSQNGLARLGQATIGRADNALAEFSAVRDNLTRLPHFIAALEKGNHSSLEEAMYKAAAEVHDYHPTSLAGSGFEQKYLRRAFYFYTWTRQAASRIIRTALDRPGLITIPSKFQYEMASANGLNPESIGVPFDPDNENIPDYHRETILGPTYFGGMTPVPDPEGKTSWGYSLSSPQIDALQTLFEGANTVPGQTGLEGTGNQLGTGAYDLIAGNLNPLLKAPAVLASGKDPSSTEFRDVDRTKWLADQGGILTTGAKLTGGYQQAFPGAIDPKTGEPYKTPDEVAADQQRTLLNALTGLKLTSYDDETSAAVAASQRKKREQAAKRAN